MSRHWRPEGKVIEGPWTRADAYRVPRRTRPSQAVIVLLGAALVGTVGGLAWQRWPARIVGARPDAPIEWNAVQAVPVRARAPDEIEWEKRGQDGVVATSDTVAVEASRESGLSSASNVPNGTLYVIDGDTFTMAGRRIRVAGIDAPETHPPHCADEARLGLAATVKLRELLSNGAVTVERARHDKYGRDVRQVRVGGRDVAEIMIGAGLARSYDGGKRQPWC